VTQNIKLDRRRILIAGGVATAGAAAYGAAGVIGAARRCREFAAASEAAAQSARRIGAAYLRVHPEEASEVRLMAALAGRSALTSALKAAPDMAAVFCIMDDIVRADFAAGEIVNCSGWILAKSEARACALFTLRAARAA
jgi:hypothetical protein